MRAVIIKKQWGIMFVLDGEPLLCLEKTSSKIYRYYIEGIPGIRKGIYLIEDEDEAENP